jgi:hypothetical protein
MAVKYPHECKIVVTFRAEKERELMIGRCGLIWGGRGGLWQAFLRPSLTSEDRGR